MQTLTYLYKYIYLCVLLYVLTPDNKPIFGMYVD